MAIPKIIDAIRALIQMALTVQKQMKEKKNEDIRKKVENATTPEEKQDALDDAGKRFGSN